MRELLSAREEYTNTLVKQWLKEALNLKENKGSYMTRFEGKTEKEP